MSNRAVGQFKRGLKSSDPYERLALSVLDQSVRDAHSLWHKSARTRFQPGYKTTPAELEVYADELGKWALSYDFEFWCLHAGIPEEDTDWYRHELLRILNHA